jgi:two-component sensor histidine kinase/ABC-type amino acid transport substrate-binding protein
MHGKALKRLFLALACSMLLMGAELDAEAVRVRIGVFHAAPLVEHDDSRAMGFFVDLAEYFAHALGLELDYVRGEWSDHLESLKRGELDLLPAVSYTREREAVYDFSRNPVFVDSGVLFKSPRLAVHTIYDLSGRRIAALEGSAFTDGFERMMESFSIDHALVLTSTNEEAMELVKNGGADACVCIYSLGRELMKRYPVEITPISFSPFALHFAAPEGDPKGLIAAIDGILPGLIEDRGSIYATSYSRWLEERRTSVPEWLAYALYGLAALGISLALWTFLLKRQVARKTRSLSAEVALKTEAEGRLLEALKEKDALLREVYHRTKNTLQIARSLLRLQAEEFEGNEGVARLVGDTDERIQSIALVHQMLYQSKRLSRIELADYVRELGRGVLHGGYDTATRIRFDADIADCGIVIDVAVPLGLALNELLTNSARHAFPDGRSGRVSIVATLKEALLLELVYADDGVGIGDPSVLSAHKSLGLGLVRAMIEEQLDGELSYDLSSGFKCTIKLSLSRFEERV